MDITNIKITLFQVSRGRIRAFCDITFDNEFAVHNIKIMEENRGLYLTMPEKENSKNCINCNEKIPLRAKFCNRCGIELPCCSIDGGKNIHSELYTSIVEVIDSKSAELIKQKVIKAYNIALKNLPEEKLTPGNRNFQSCRTKELDPALEIFRPGAR